MSTLDESRGAALDALHAHLDNLNAALAAADAELDLLHKVSDAMHEHGFATAGEALDWLEAQP